MVSSPDTTDYEADAFEDARDTAQDPEISTLGSTRSLTDRRTSNGSILTPKAASFSKPLPGTTEDETDKTPPTSPTAKEEDTPRKQKPKSPILSANRLSSSSLDEVNLSKDDDAGSPGAASPHTAPNKSNEGPPPLPSRDSPKQSNHSQGLSGSLPSIPWGPPPVNKNLPPQPQAPAPPTRKLTSPFTWLSRAATSQKDSIMPRRHTGASISTIVSNSERLDGSDGDALSMDSRRQKRNSLKDQFKLLRMRDEGNGTTGDDQASVKSAQEDTSTVTVSSPSGKLETSEAGSTNSSPLASPLPPPINPNLAPGTVSGISASASDAAAPVDWELWQQIVNNGPEALSGGNAEELNAAIKRGIPQTIRGVIWQVLSDSRNPDLEEVYRELSARGTDKERNRYRSASSATSINGHTNGSPKERGSVASSRSSVHSEPSTPAAGSVHDVPTLNMVPEHDSDAVMKVQAELEQARNKKAKEEALALQKLEKAIRRDLGSRTSYSKYFMSQKNQEALFNVCKAYALYDIGVGYAQGMSFVVMPLLFNMDEGEAFTLLVRLMNKYGLRNMFVQDMPGLHLQLYQFERLLEDLEPALACHLRRRDVHPQLYATQWFLTLFAYRFPLQLVLRIYDLIFDEGVESTILRFAVAIMQRNAKALLEMNDMTALTSFLKEKLFDAYIDKQPSPSSILESGFFGSSGPSDKEIYRADIMVDDACSINLTPEMIKRYTSEWEEKVRIEKEQAAELENYRQTVTTQSNRIRSLEEHAEKSDQEHVQLASELVRIKVENGELQDSNESLKVQVEELKSVIDRQPAELEDKLRTEMDRIMKRNIEVQNENRAMDEQMAEMEKDLVETKMKWAEISENYETLKQKWNDLRKALD